MNTKEYTREEHLPVIIVGGGASGMLCALLTARRGLPVLLLEKNEKTGKKLFITGKGRCNVTNDCDPNTFMQQVNRNARFMYSAFYGFTPQDMMDLLEALGVPLKVERGNRVFPASDKSSDILRALNRGMHEAGVTIRLHTRVTGILFEDGCAVGVEAEDENRKQHVYRASDVVLACGGLAYPSTGAGPDGYRLAESAGHTVTKLRPSLVPMNSDAPWLPDLMGLSLKNTALSVTIGAKTRYTDFGEMLFTHFGVSGPMILSASGAVGNEIEEAAAKNIGIMLHLDLKPALSEEQLDARLLREFEKGKNKQIRTILQTLLPGKLVPVMCSVCGGIGDLPVHDLTRNGRKTLISNIKDFRIPVTGLRGYNEAVVTAGGVSTKEIIPKTMASRCAGHLYIVGELLDVDAMTGGFNLQIAWSTAAAAARAICEQE